MSPAPFAALSGAIAVAAGAFGAHGAEGKAAEWLRTGGQYQLVHALAALLAAGRPGGRAAAWMFVAGGATFAGSLYALALGAPRWLGATAPLGGVLLILGWLALAVAAFRATPTDKA